MVGLIVGLYFLVDLIMGRKIQDSNSRNDESTTYSSQTSSGISPIYVTPIPYNNISPSTSSSSRIPQTSPSSLTANYNAVTYPSYGTNAYESKVVNSKIQPAVTSP